MMKTYRYMDFSAPHPRKIDMMIICVLCDWPLVEGQISEHVLDKHDIDAKEVITRTVSLAPKYYDTTVNKMVNRPLS